MSEYGLCENGKVMVMRIEREMPGSWAYDYCCDLNTLQKLF